MRLHKRAVIANAKFIYKADQDQLTGKLKYFEYRDDKQTHVFPHGEGERRWVDRGLGDSYSEIAQTATALSTMGLAKDVAARTLVIAPQMDFMAAIPEKDREKTLAELTEATVEQWFAQANLPTPAYSFVIHQGDVAESRVDGQDKDLQRSEAYYHSHVVLAATIPGLEQDREDYKVYSDVGRVPKTPGLNAVTLTGLHESARDTMALIWERELGRDRVQSLNQDLEQLTQALEQKDIERAIPDPLIIESTTRDLRQFFGLEPQTESVHERAQPMPDQSERPVLLEPDHAAALPTRDEIDF